MKKELGNDIPKWVRIVFIIIAILFLLLVFLRQVGMFSRGFPRGGG
jgi:hypothetical protein